jgi:pyruvate,water dikinase
MNIFSFIKNKFFPTKKELSNEELDNLFKQKYNKFKILINANNNTLKTMAEMEQAFYGDKSYGMVFIRTHTTSIIVNIFKMVKNLIELSDGRYSRLDEKLEEMKDKIIAIYEKKIPIPSGNWCVSIDKAGTEPISLLGEKMTNLGKIKHELNLCVSPAFVITSAAYYYFILSNDLQNEINRMLNNLDPENLEELYKTSDDIKKIIITAPLPNDLESVIYKNYQNLEKITLNDVLVSLRSSATSEDSKDASFAGQYLTKLHVRKDDIISAYKEVIASKYTPRALIYRLKKGFRDEDIAMSVGCMVMVDASVSGVMYTIDPLDPKSDFLVINAAKGLADSIVDGTARPFVIKVSRDNPGNIIKEEYERFGDFEICNEIIKKIFDAGMALEDYFKKPQDIEWSLDKDNNITILQSRTVQEKTCDNSLNTSLLPENTIPLISGGATINSGISFGNVFVILEKRLPDFFPEGSVMVLKNPLPEFASLLSRASAVISETGGMAGHLATISREFGIPAIFGMENATDILKDAGEVTVDANGCRVYQGKIEALLAQDVRKKIIPMQGSPVQDIMREILILTVPLSLLDPLSPYFRPSACKTLHDITRFCHEKAVEEISFFGKDNKFNDREAKRLVVNGNTLSDWWVINLSDGFKNMYDQVFRFINISDIVSAPMLSLWEGINAEPWAGPPPIDARGFGSILFGSTMNPGFQPELASSMTAKNYFMVSKDYCNLSMRLGYHFAVVESQISDVIHDNYVSFSFRGGAADERRREMRVELISDILKKYDFRVELKGDSLFARFERESGDAILLRLKMLGYLVIHTRQIDMVMYNGGMVKEYEDKLLAGIERLLVKGGG